MKLREHLIKDHRLPEPDQKVTHEQLKRFHDEAHSSGRVGSAQSKSYAHAHPGFLESKGGGKPMRNYNPDYDAED